MADEKKNGNNQGHSEKRDSGTGHIAYDKAPCRARIENTKTTPVRDTIPPPTKNKGNNDKT